MTGPNILQLRGTRLCMNMRANENVIAGEYSSLGRAEGVLMD